MENVPGVGRNAWIPAFAKQRFCATPIHRVKERRERAAWAHAAPAAMADVEDPLEFLVDLRRVARRIRLSIERVPRARPEAAFAQSHAQFQNGPIAAYHCTGASSAFRNRFACERSAFAKVSNQSAISVNPSWRAWLAIPD
jgi:hypothetical protein